MNAMSQRRLGASQPQTPGGERIQGALFYALAAASIAAALYLFSTYGIVPINEDGGFYISIARDVLNGATPTVDVSTTYTTGVFYIIASLMKLFGDRYSTVLLFIYLVQAANTVMLYAILLKMSAKRSIAVFACLSYYYSHMLLDGLYFELEPFQVFFILLAIILMLSAARTLYKFPLVGLCLGCSIMCKQYSTFALLAVCLVTWREVRRSDSAYNAFAAVIAIALCAAVPFLVFVALTKATFIGSLYAFGFLGAKATSYATQGTTDPGLALKNFLVGLVHMNWLYLPVVAACLAYFLRIKLRLNPLFPLLFGLFILPQFVRQHGHYYQLIAPWAFIIGAAAVDGIVKSEEGNVRFLRRMVLPASLICFVVLPLFLVFSQSFYAVPPPHPLIARTTFLFLLCAAFVAAGGQYLLRKKLNAGSVILIVMSLLFFETLFLSLKLPFGVYAEKKSEQAREAAALNSVFPRGSEVYVVDYPQLYFTCNFVSPIGNYGFPLTEKKAERIDWTKIDKLIIRDGHPTLSRQMLYTLGYRQLDLQSALPLNVYIRKMERDAGQPVPAFPAAFR